jgi:hypothetical protein
LHNSRKTAKSLYQLDKHLSVQKLQRTLLLLDLQSSQEIENPISKPDLSNNQQRSFIQITDVSRIHSSAQGVTSVTKIVFKDGIHNDNISVSLTVDRCSVIRRNIVRKSRAFDANNASLVSRRLDGTSVIFAKFAIYVFEGTTRKRAIIAKVA